MKIDGRSKDLVLLATALGKQCIILGYTWLEDENPDIDWRKNTLTWRTKPHRNIYAMIRPVKDEEPNDQNLVISFIKGKMTPQATEDWISSRMSHLQLFAQNDKKEERPVEEIVPKEFHKYLTTVFTEREIGRLPPQMAYDHAIDLIPDFVPRKGAQFRTNLKEDAEMLKFIEENKAKGFIRKLTSPQATSLFFVPKKDGKTRPVQDYRDLNKQMIKNVYPLLHIDTLIDELSGFDLFIKMDVRWGYNNVRIKKGDEWKAAFTCKAGLFEPTVMFFGLTNSPATFQAMMDDIFHDEIAQGWLKAYMDDPLLCGHKVDHPTLVKRGLHVLKKLWEHDLFIKPEKCNFFVSQVEFLGFVIDEGTVQMDPTKVDGIVDWPPPQNLTELRSFVGFCNFYHRFIDHYSDKCQPLTTLTKKTQQWKWTNAEPHRL